MGIQPDLRSGHADGFFLAAVNRRNEATYFGGLRLNINDWRWLERWR
ncbi:MAG: hypothetical protein AB4426_30930 [Xenococcaceae cyanobacterium]